VICSDSFLSFLKTYEKKKKTHNMLSLILNSQFKSFHLVSSFVDDGQDILITEKYDKKSLHVMFLKCYYHLHHMVDHKIRFSN
jgi:hypothetical protein